MGRDELLQRLMMLQYAPLPLQRCHLLDFCHIFLESQIGAPIGPVIPTTTSHAKRRSMNFVLCLFFLNVLRTYHKQLSQL